MQGDFVPRPRDEPFIPLPRDEFGDPVIVDGDNEIMNSQLIHSHADPFSLQDTDTSILSSLHEPLDDSSYGDSQTEYVMGPILKAMLHEWSQGDELLTKKKRKRKTSREQQSVL